MESIVWVSLWVKLDQDFKKLKGDFRGALVVGHGIDFMDASVFLLVGHRSDLDQNPLHHCFMVFVIF